MGIIRLTLDFSVLIGHSVYYGKLMPPADIAVQMFFIISGFYMDMILNTKYTSHVVAFYKNRFFRLYPIYISVVLAIILLRTISSIPALGFSGNSFGLSIIAEYEKNTITLGTALFLLLSNLSMLFQDVVMFLRLENGVPVIGYFKDSIPPLHKFLYIPQAWSLGLEIMFYIIAPFIAKSYKKLFAILIISFSIRFLFIQFGKSADPFSYRFFPSELSTFIMGALSWHIFNKIRFYGIQKNLLLIQVLLLFVFIFWPYFFYPFSGLARHAFFIFFAFLVPYFYNHYQNNKLDRKIGELSYPFYLSHGVALSISVSVMKKLGGGDSVMILTVLMATFLTFFASTILLFGVQKHFDKIRKNIVASFSQTATDKP